MSLIEKLNKMDNYSYQLEVNEEVIVGYISKGNNTFAYEGVEYTYTNDLMSNFKYQDIIKYTNTKIIYNLIHDIEYDSKTEYKNKSISKTYIIDDIEVVTYESNNQIYQVELKIANNSFKIAYG